jgi:hypothetical protein
MARRCAGRARTREPVVSGSAAGGPPTEAPAWAHPSEVDPGTGVAEQLLLMRQLANGEIRGPDFETRWLAARGRELEHGERTRDEFNDLLRAVYGLVEDYIADPALFEPGDVTEPELVQGVREILQRLHAIRRPPSRGYVLIPDVAWNRQEEVDGVLVVHLTHAPDALAGQPADFVVSPQLVADLEAAGLSGYRTGPAKGFYRPDGAASGEPAPPLKRFIVGQDFSEDFALGPEVGLTASQRAVDVLRGRCQALRVRPMGRNFPRGARRP